MFILRTILTYSDERNTFLGKEYTIVYRDHKEFDTLIKDHHLTMVEKEIDSLVLDENRDCHPIYNNQVAHYIVTESGKTFFKFKQEPR